MTSITPIPTKWEWQSHQLTIETKIGSCELAVALKQTAGIIYAIHSTTKHNVMNGGNRNHIN